MKPHSPSPILSLRIQFRPTCSRFGHALKPLDGFLDRLNVGDIHDRKMQRALLQFFKPANWFTVREALLQAGRGDLIGNGCDCLIPEQPPKEAIESRRRRANDHDHYHTVANPAKGEKPGERGSANKGYRPGRKRARRQGKKHKHNGDQASSRS